MSDDRTDSVIEAIDGALEDWSVSSDAMRWTPDPPSAGQGRRIPLPAPDRAGRPSWLAGLQLIEDPSVPEGTVALVVNRDVEPVFYDGPTPVRLMVTEESVTARVAPGIVDEERERLLRRIAEAYDVPLCLAAGHRWGPEELVIGVDMDRASDTVHGVDQYRQTCTRCNQVVWRLADSWTWTLGG